MSDRREHEREEHARIESEIRRGADSADPFAAAVRATRMPMLITDPNRPDNPIVFTNDAFLRLTGYAREEVIGRNCRFLQGPSTDRADVARIRDAIERRVPIELELLNHKKNGEVFWNRLLLSPVFGEDGTLFYFFASQFDVTLERDRLVRLQSDRDALEREVERRTHDLRHGEDHLRFILGAGRLGTWTLDLSDRRLLASELCKAIFGRTVSEPLTYEDLLAAVVPEDRERMREAMNASIAHNAVYDIEYRIVTREGETRWVEFRGQTYYRADGQPLSMAGVAIDITGRKRVEEQRELLSAELKHRVKNSMATIQSIAHQTLRNAASVEEARGTLDARLASLSAAHDILTRRHWEGASLDELAISALEPFRAGQPDRFRIGGPSLVMEPRVALSLVLALHELATNAVKYGALSNDKGRVLLSWDVSGTPKPDRLWLRWEETGGPPVTPPTRNGFGRRMIERALAAELGGAAEIAYRPRGVVFTVDAPLPNQGARVGEAAEA